MYKKRDKVRIKRIVLDLHDVIAGIVFKFICNLLSADEMTIVRNNNL